MTEHRHLLLIALIALLSGCTATTPARYTCPYTTSGVVIDGRLDEAAWARAPWTSYFVDIQGDTHPTPRFRTRAKMLWDDDNFYIAADMEEPHVWGSLTEHDQVVYHDNDFEVFIDPDGDRREYYEVEVNVLNTIFDLFLHRTYIDGGPADHDWTCVGMRTAIHVDGTINDHRDADRGWSVEIAIPWTAVASHAHMPIPPQANDTWRVNFSRVQWHHRITDAGMYEKIPNTPEDNWVWTPQHAINMHLPEHWGFVTFVR